MKSFSSLEQRMVSTYLDTFPPFVPDETGPDLRVQESFYRFLSSIYHLLYENPALLAKELHEDDAHDNRFNAASYGKPELKPNMRKMTKAVDEFLSALLELGKAGRAEGSRLVFENAVKVKKPHRQLLEALGVRVEGTIVELPGTGYDGLPEAWPWMAKKPGMTPLIFSRCLLKDGYNYGSLIYRELLGDREAFLRLEQHFIDRGYRRIDNREPDKISLDYVKGYDPKETVKGGFNYGVRHTGISCNYADFVKEPPFIGLCIYRYRDVLSHFDEMDEASKTLIHARTKRCDACGYCVQGKLDGKRALANVPVDYHGERLRLCSYFPGYGYCWTRLDDGVVDSMIALTEFMDRLFSK